MIIKNCLYVDWQTLEFSKCSLKVEEKPKGSVFKIDKEDPADKNIINAHGKIVTKSFVCAHHHIYSALARGMDPPHSVPQDFSGILKKIWWVLDRSLDGEMIRSSAEVTALYCLKNGVSTVIDHHASPSYPGESLHIIADVFKKAGIEYMLAYELSDRDGPLALEAGLDETRKYLEAGNPGLVGLHASFTAGDELLKMAVELAKKTGSGIHIHAAEDIYDQKHCMETYGKRVIERFDDAGILSMSKSILAHCIHINDHERKLVRDSEAWIVQNPDSNLNNKVGFFNGKEIGDRVMYGTDGMHSDMIKTAQTAWFANTKEDELLPDIVYDRLRNSHIYLSQSGFAGDGNNNLIMLDYDSPTPVNPENFSGHLLYGMENRHIAAHIIQGRLVYESSAVKTLNENEILSESRKQANRLWKQMKKTGVHE